jgi:hypothetical protein
MVHDSKHAANRDQNSQAGIMQLCRARQLRILQKMMATTLVNGHLASEYVIDKELRLQESTNSFALVLCAKVGWSGGGGW